jgi:hypothetical protein
MSLEPSDHRSSSTPQTTGTPAKKKPYVYPLAGEKTSEELQKGNI